MPNLFPSTRFNDEYVNSLLVGLEFSIFDDNFSNSNRTLHRCMTDDCVSLKLINSIQIRESVIIAQKVTVKNKDYWSINCTFSNPDYRGQGNMISLYRILIEQFKLKIVSDTMQSIPGTYNIWRKLIDKTKDINRFWILNCSTGKRSGIKNVDESKIWGISSDVLYYENLDLMNELYLDGAIEKVLYDFTVTNVGKIADKEHIRLFVESVN